MRFKVIGFEVTRTYSPQFDLIDLKDFIDLIDLIDLITSKP